MERMHWSYEDLMSLPQEYLEALIEKLTNEAQERE
jgi:hypothetical protein